LCSKEIFFEKTAIYLLKKRYLEALAKGGLLHKHKLWRENYYINHELTALLFEMPELEIR
jgi:hypothetical protein